MEFNRDLMNEEGRKAALRRTKKKLNEAGASLVLGDVENADNAFNGAMASMVEYWIQNGDGVDDFKLQYYCDVRGLDFDELRPLVKRYIPHDRRRVLRMITDLGENIASRFTSEDVG